MEPPPLPLRSRLLYAFSSLGSEALTQSRGLWLLYYYAPPSDADLEQQLPRLLAGALIFGGRLLEAFDDALIGYWSDRSHSRWGRRIPFIVAATPLWALFSFLLFAPPPAGTVGTGLYLFLALELFFLFATLSSGPYEALLPEIASTSEERVQVQSLKVYLGFAGGAIGLVGSDLLIDTLGFKAMALTVAALALVCRYVGLLGVWERAKRSQATGAITFGEAMRATFANPAFVAFLPAFILFQIGFQMLVGVIPFYVDALLPEETWLKVRVLTAVALIAAVAAVPAFALLARRSSKRQAYRAAMLGAALTAPLLGVATLVPGVPAEAQILAVVVLAGAPVGGNYLFPATLTADIIDYDSARTGLRREATYYGSQNVVEKVATSVSPLLLSLLLLLGDSTDNPLGIRLVGIVAGLLVLTGYLAFRSYDLPDHVAEAEPAR